MWTLWLDTASPSHRIKRGMDILLAAFGLLVLSHLIGVIALLIRLTSPGPVFYASARVGRDCQLFPMLKFRTMRVDADDLRDQLRAEAGLEGQLFKLKNDPRITSVGHWLRATSLDELPQLVNVLRGEMSLVGPRPLPMDESALFRAPYTLRYSVRPGITGQWQVSGRSNADFNQLCQLEYSYLSQWSLARDLGILMATVPAVLMRRGAC